MRRKRAQPPLTHAGVWQAIDRLAEKNTACPHRLSPRQAVVLEMLYQRDMDVAEVAEVLAVEPQTVRSTHHKALVRLRAHFREEEP